MSFILLALLLAALTNLSPAADNASVAGQWKLHSNIQGHESDLDCTFAQTGQELSGTCKADRNELKITGKVEEKKLTFQYKTDYQGQELTVIHSGTIEAPTKLAGSVEVQPMGVFGEFTATQSK